MGNFRFTILEMESFAGGVLQCPGYQELPKALLPFRSSGLSVG